MEVNELLKLMVNKGASDLHLTVPSPPVLRIDGVLIPQEDLRPLTAKMLNSSWNKLLMKSKGRFSIENGSWILPTLFPG